MTMHRMMQQNRNLGDASLVRGPQLVHEQMKLVRMMWHQHPRLPTNGYWRNGCN